MNDRQKCSSCGLGISSGARHCMKCGTQVEAQQQHARAGESLNIRILYIMVGLLVLAVLFPPWEAAPEESPQFLGMAFILSPPREGAIVSRMLQTIQLVTIAVGGMYASWLFRSK
ncbi:zinc ribbon domain-containing protein [Nitrospira sp. M1]